MKIIKNFAISESGFVFNPGSGESFSVNPIGVEIINLLKEDMSPQEISRKIIARYHTDPATFEKDFQDFVELLKHHLLIEDHEKEA